MRPIFTQALDARPDVAAWLGSLDDQTKRLLRDDVTPMFKEVATEPKRFDQLRGGDIEPMEHQTDQLLDAVLDALRRSPQNELFPEMGGGLHGLAMRAAHESMPAWQFRAFSAWARGTNRSRIAKNLLGVSRATVRCALDGNTRHNHGAIETFIQAIRADEAFMKAVATVAAKSSKAEQRALLCARGWFSGFNNRPGMVGPMAMLMLLDEIAGPSREVKVADVLTLFPPSLISDYMLLLSAHGYAKSNGHVIRIHKIPVEKESTV